MNCLLAQLGDRDLDSRRQPVLRRHDERQVIGVDHLRDQALVFRIVGQDAQLQIAVDQLRRDLARQAPPDLHLDLRIPPPIALDVIQQVQRRRLVRANRQPPRRLVAQLGQRVFELRPAGSRSAARSRAPPGRRRSAAAPWPSRSISFSPSSTSKPLNRQRDSRLRAQQLLGRPGETLLGGHRQEHA